MKPVPPSGDPGPGLDELTDWPEVAISLPLIHPLRSLVRTLFPGSEEDPAGPDTPRNVASSAIGTMRLLGLVVTPFSAAWFMGFDDPEIAVADLAQRWNEWAWRERPPPALAALIASSLVVHDQRVLVLPECAPLARALWDYVRDAGVTGWSAALEEGRRWWDEPASRDLVWGIVARGLMDVSGYQKRSLEALQRELDEATPPWSPDDDRDGLEPLRTELANARAEADRLRGDLEHDRDLKRSFRERCIALEDELRRRRAEGPPR